MTVMLSPETQRLLEQKLKDGSYHSVDEVLRAALLAMDELEQQALDEQTLNAIDQAEDQIERGDVHDWQAVRQRVQAQLTGQ